MFNLFCFNIKIFINHIFSTVLTLCHTEWSEIRFEYPVKDPAFFMKRYMRILNKCHGYWTEVAYTPPFPPSRVGTKWRLCLHVNKYETKSRHSPQIRRPYEIRNKAAINLTFDFKSGKAALYFIPYCRLIWGHCPKFRMESLVMESLVLILMMDTYLGIPFPDKPSFDLCHKYCK